MVSGARLHATTLCRTTNLPPHPTSSNRARGALPIGGSVSPYERRCQANTIPFPEDALLTPTRITHQQPTLVAPLSRQHIRLLICYTCIPPRVFPLFRYFCEPGPCETLPGTNICSAQSRPLLPPPRLPLVPHGTCLLGRRTSCPPCTTLPQ